MSTTKQVVAILLALVWVSTAAMAGPLEDAVAAYDRGDYATALKLSRPLAEQGHARAQNGLGLMYGKGLGVAQNYAEAVKWFRLAADQGYAKAQYNLGGMYYGGQGVKQDYAEAVKWYRLAAEQGYAKAQYNLGFAYATGEGVAQNYAEAVKWYRMAAEQEYAWAQHNLGRMYENGQGVGQDYAEAVKWYRMAAEQGDALAHNSLGIMYGNGLGVAQDYVLAHMWWSLAAAQGIKAAADALPIIAKRLTPDQIAEAQRLAAEWKPGTPLKTAGPALPLPEKAQKPVSEEQGPTPAPALESLISLPPQNLAAGFLAVDETISWIERAVRIGFTLTTSLDGTPKTITKANADTFLKAYRERLDVYGQAIKQRGSPKIDGRYALAASASCRGEKLDPREIFAGSESGGKPVMVDELNVRQTGFKVELVMSATRDGEVQQIVFPGIAVEDAAVFRAPNLGFYLWGSVLGQVIELRMEVSDVQRALGESAASPSDWKAIGVCVFSLTPQ